MVRHWIDPGTGRRWLVAVSDQGGGWTEGRPVRLIWFARNREFWSTELYLEGHLDALADEVLGEHLERAQEGWYQGSGAAGRRR